MHYLGLSGGGKDRTCVALQTSVPQNKEYNPPMRGIVAKHTLVIPLGSSGVEENKGRN